jgi:tRNA(Arg) A34 adenosine deaminase TadA
VSDQVVDELWMRRALDLAEEAGRADEVPVGAVLVSPDGRCCGKPPTRRGIGVFSDTSST